jgi:hypothetical protein
LTGKSVPDNTLPLNLLPKPNLNTIPTTVDKRKIVVDTIKVPVLGHGEALQQADSDVAGFGEGELLADADAGAAVELCLCVSRHSVKLGG